MSEMNLFGKWKIKRKHFWIALGIGVPLLCIIGFLGVALFAPAMGSVSDFSFSGYGVSYDAATSEEAYFYNETADMEMEEDMAEMVRAEAPKMPGEMQTASNGNVAVAERLIIREGNIILEVDKTVQTHDDIEAIVNSMADKGAYVITSSESSRGEGKEPYISMVIRVPVEDFARVMDQIADMGIEVIDRHESGQDVTEEYVDLKGRVEEFQTSIDRLLEIMKNADNTEDLLNAERELTIRAAELEALQGRMNYLAQSASLSRINITLQPYELSEPIDTTWKPAETFRRAIENLIDSMQGFAEFLIVFTVNVLPWLIFFGLIIWGVVAIVRRRKRKKQTQAEQ